MRKTRTINHKRLREWLDNEGTRTQLHDESGVSFEWIDKASSGKYDSEPTKRTVRDVCRATGIKENELFPLVSAKGEIAS